MSDNRDPGTGKLTVWGYTERLAKVAALLLIPLLLWAVRVEVFMSQGERWTSKDAETQTEKMRTEWRTDLQDAIKDGQLPIADQRLTRLEEDVQEIRQDQKHILATVEGNKSAIQLLLERSDR